MPDATQPAAQQPDALLRLPAVLKQVPVCKSAWWIGIRAGRYPAGFKLSPKVTVWRQSDIDALIARLGR